MTVSPPPASARARAETLRGLCGGAVHLPGDPGYDLARAPWNAQVESFPAAVAYPAFPDEVADVLRAASAAGLEVAPQGTGHGAAPLAGRLGDAVLLRTAALGELSIDAGPAGRPGRRRRAVGRPRGRRRHRRAGRAAPLVPGRRRRRVLDRRRHRLVRPPARPAVQRDHRRRGRPRRRHLRPRHRRRGRRALLGAARRRRAARRRHGPGVPALRDRQRRRGLPRLGLDAGRAGPPRAGRPGAPRPRTRSRRPSACCTPRRSRRSPPSCGAAGWSSSTARCSAPTARAAEVLAPLRALGPGVRHAAPGCRRRRWCGCTSNRRARAPPTRAARC